MVFNRTKASEQKMRMGWVALPNGAHATTSPAIITQTLKAIIRERLFLTLLIEGYQSGKSALVDFDEQTLTIDRPSDWPGHRGMLKLLFKDKENLWNQFLVKVLEERKDVLVTSFPAKQLRLQRRASYRVEVPRGSRAMFLYKGELQRNFYVQDISAEGAMFFSPGRRSPLSQGDTIADIALTFPSETPKTPNTIINVRLGRIMRVFTNEQGEVCYGVRFELTHGEEEQLLQYVRQRERELLRKGVAG